MIKQTQTYQHSVSKIPVDIKLVEECEIDAENIQEGFEHKLFYQCAEKHLAEQNYLQKIAEKKASLARAKAEFAKKWWFIKSEHILVTTNCPICREQCLLHIDRPVCSACENKYELGGIEA
jgi:hypothetical protein